MYNVYFLDSDNPNYSVCKIASCESSNEATAIVEETEEKFGVRCAIYKV